MIEKVNRLIKILEVVVTTLDQICAALMTSKELRVDVKALQRLNVRRPNSLKETSNKLLRIAEVFSKAELSARSAVKKGPISERILREAANKMLRLAKAFNETSEAFERFDKVCETPALQLQT